MGAPTWPPSPPAFGTPRHGRGAPLPRAGGGWPTAHPRPLRSACLLSPLQSQVRSLHRLAREEIRAASLENHAPVLDDVTAVGQPEGLTHVLLHEENAD